MAEHNDKNEYNKRMPPSAKVPNTSGYPNNIKSTQTQKTRGTGAATKGNKHSTKMG
jgi:hypothetical protein